MRPHYTLNKSNNADADAAASEALKGAGVGALKFGIPLALLSCLGFAFSPIYRSLTIQFKVFLQMSGMTLGGWIEADRRLRAYEVLARARRKVGRDEVVWKRWEGLVEEEVGEAERIKGLESSRDGRV